MSKRKEQLKELFGINASKGVASQDASSKGVGSKGVGSKEAASKRAGSKAPAPKVDQASSMPVNKAAPEQKSMPPTDKATDKASAVPPRAASGAVKAMGLSLNKVNEDIAAAKALRENIANGEQIIEIDPNMIDRSMVEDRLSLGSIGDDQFEILLASMRDSGQQVPVLVRPHPDAKKRDAGYFQAAYGHRRIQAALKLGIAIKAIVRDLNDEELVVAQGKENADRRNLSFIERAFFAKGLLAHGFDRATIQTAMSIHKTELTRFLQVSEAVPSHVAKAIGPAPKVGRPRWMALAELLKSEAAQVKARDEISSQGFRDAGSDERFQMLFARLSTRAKSTPVVKPIKDKSGAVIGSFKRNAKKSVFEINEAERPGFAEFLMKNLPQLSADFADKQAAKKDT